MTEPARPDVQEVTITPLDNGSYRVRGPVVLVDAEGGRWRLPEGKAVFLCRCGQSENKPFCDSTHKRVGFTCTVRAPKVEEPAAETAG